MSFSEHGFDLIDSFLSEQQLRAFQSEFKNLATSKTSGGVRNAEQKFAVVNEFVSSNLVLNEAQRYLGVASHFVRAIVFNKTQRNNWSVPLHQDKTVAVSCQFDDSAWGPWSEKDGVVHVQPPQEVLNAMVTFRVHIDSSTEENGCLSVVPGSHKLGILNQHEITQLAQFENRVSCPAPAGSALVMRPHLLHASSKGSIPSQRRVLHVEYCGYELPKGITWASVGE